MGTGSSVIDMLNDDLSTLPCMVCNWPKYIQTTNLWDQFVLLSEDFDGGGNYGNFRNAQTNDEWLSLLFHIMLTTIGNSKQLHQDGDFHLTSRCKMAVKHLELEEGTTIKHIYTKVFMGTSAPEAMFFNSLLWKSFKEETHGRAPGDSTLQTLNSCFKLVNVNLLSEEFGLNGPNKIFFTKKLSVVDMCKEPASAKCPAKNSTKKFGFDCDQSYLDFGDK